MTAATGTAPAEVAAWMDAAVAGDRAAYGRLYERYQDVIFRFVYFRVGSRQLAEDLTADTFTRALVRIGTFVWQGRDPAAWFVTIARNLVADYYKSGRYRLEITTEDVGGFGTDLADFDVAASPELAAVRHFDAVEVLTAVQSLTAEQRECLVLRFLHGMSVREAAHVMGRTEAAVKALTWRALQAAGRAMRHPEPTIPRQRRPVDEPEVDQLILWRCRTCTTVYFHPRLSHGEPPCDGWLEPILKPGDSGGRRG